MRQRGMCAEDIAFRTALVNMRYAQCTDDDISLLNSRVFSPGRSSGVQTMRGFEEVSIITTRNAHRDAVNADNAERFAARHGRALHFFYSKDTWGKVKDSASIRKAQHEYRTITDPARTSNRIPGPLQDALWRLSPAMSDHHAGMLALCEDMPVLLKTNEATELCATNGAPGKVAGWESHTDAEGREYLDVLFIRLVDPPQIVQLDGLPENVIPIGRLKRSVRCTLPVGDITITVQREQVPCLQNFALTDYACQGLTRLLNVIYAKYSRNHQSVYTMLSRSSSLTDTIILGYFDSSKLRCGAAPPLLQEFRELEILDEITALQEKNQLAPTVQGSSRGELILSFLQTQRMDYVPPRADPSLPWESFPRNGSPALATARRSTRPGITHRSVSDLKRSHAAEEWLPAKKIRERSPLVGPSDSSMRLGFSWDSRDWSCAYDSFFTVLWNIRHDEGDAWFDSMPLDNILMRALVTRFRSLPENPFSLETVRDTFRDILSIYDPALFPRRGASTASVSDLILALVRCPEPFGNSVKTCSHCSVTEPCSLDVSVSYMWTVLPGMLRIPRGSDASIQHAVDQLLHPSEAPHCSSCRSPTTVSTVLSRPPPIVVLEVSYVENLSCDDEFVIAVGARSYRWHLRGVIYHGSNHFTCRYLSSEGNVWYHDGASTGQNCIRESVSADRGSFKSAYGRTATHYIYTLRTQTPE
ncbi:hypothetical protein OH77DRAFT_1456690 [Trametes cingulata]|nr:hypothetical protein OH77DRAFT_1456690 [Trametes cingulata]